MDLTTKTPAEIDGMLAEIYTEIAVARLDGKRYRDDLYLYVGKVLDLDFKQVAALEQVDEVVERLQKDGAQDWNEQQVLRMFAAKEEAARILHAAIDKARPFEDEFHRRGGWTRAFLATSANGHIHRSRSCSTCFATTQFFWFTDLSGHDEAEIVAKAGSDACTVCYPSAPVNDLKRPRSIFSDDEKAAQKAREEKAAAKAARDAAAITVTWQESGRAKERTFKTQRALTNALASDLHSLCWYGTEHPSASEWLANVEAGREVLGEAWDYDKALATARKKTVKDAGRYLHVEVRWENGQTEEIWHDEPLYPKY